LVQVVLFEPDVLPVGVLEVAAPVVVEAVVPDHDVPAREIQALDVDPELRRRPLDVVDLVVLDPYVRAADDRDALPAPARDLAVLDGDVLAGRAIATFGDDRDSVAGRVLHRHAVDLDELALVADADAVAVLVRHRAAVGVLVAVA